jgi:hypothetical protein
MPCQLASGSPQRRSSLASASTALLRCAPPGTDLFPVLSPSLVGPSVFAARGGLSHTWLPCWCRNHTAGAVTARDEDEDRVNSYAAHLYSQYPLAFKMPVRGPMCEKVVDRLLLNFYRHPGTALYLKMVTGYDSCV